MKAYKVHIGYSLTGRTRYRNFSTLQAAKDFCERVWQASGVVLSIVYR